MLRATILCGLTLLASCTEAKQPTATQAARANTTISMPDDLALVGILDVAVREMADEVNSNNGHADVETYHVVRNSKCVDLESAVSALKRIKCDYEQSIEFSPIMADDSQIREMMQDNSRDWTKVSSIFQQSGENWKVQPPQTI